MTRIAIAIGEYPAEEKRRRIDAVSAFGMPGLDVGIVDVAASPYQPGFDGHQASDVIGQYIDAFRQAEDGGFDAVVPLGVLDIGIERGRREVSIPVVGPLFASLQMARILGDRLGLIAYSENLIPDLRLLVDRYGAGEAVADYGHIGIDLTGLAAHRGELKDRFCRVAKLMIETRGVDVIICAGISICPVHLKRSELEAALRVPVIEAIGAPIHMAAALTQLAKTPGRNS